MNNQDLNENKNANKLPKNGLITLILSILFVISAILCGTSIYAKYVKEAKVSNDVSVDISVKKVYMLNSRWKEQLNASYINSTSTIIVDNYDTQWFQLTNFKNTGKNVGAKSATDMSEFTSDVKAYYIPTSSVIFILADGDGTVSFPADCSNLFSDFTGSVFQFQKVDTSQTTDMRAMFKGCLNVTKMYNIRSFDTSNVTNMKEMFRGCNKLNSREVDGEGRCDVDMFNTSKVTDMSYMFYNCGQLTTLSVRKFDTSNVTDMKYMFYGCGKVELLDVSKFDTSNVTDMQHMFEYCFSLKKLNLVSFDTSKVTNMGMMFSSCNRLENLRLGAKFKFVMSDIGIGLSNPDTTKITQSDGKWHTKEKDDSIKSEFTGPEVIRYHNTLNSEKTYYAVKQTDKVLNMNWKNSAFLTDKTETIIVDCYYAYENELPEGVTWDVGATRNVGALSVTDTTNSTNDDVKVFVSEDKKTVYVLAFEDNPVTFPSNSSRLFASLGNNVKNLKIDYIKTSEVTDMSGMFSGNKFEELDIVTGFKEFGTSAVKKMSSMFASCVNLKEIDVSLLDTSNVTDMSNMFANCSKLNKLDLTNFDTSKVTTMKSMFNVCNALAEVTLGEKFKFVGTDGYLPTPNKTTMVGADGKWYTADGIGNTPKQIASTHNELGQTMTYYAVNPQSKDV